MHPSAFRKQNFGIPLYKYTIIYLLNRLLNDTGWFPDCAVKSTPDRNMHVHDFDTQMHKLPLGLYEGVGCLITGCACE